MPAHEVTVAAIMAATTLSRKSFYVYFRDRAELIGELVRPLRVEADAGLARWRTASDPVHFGRAALHDAARTYRRHGAILRALFWSAAEDPDIAQVRRALTESVIDAAETALGPVARQLPDRRATIRALVTMNTHSLLALPPDADDAELKHLVDTLTDIWQHAVLPTPNQPSP